MSPLRTAPTAAYSLPDVPTGCGCAGLFGNGLVTDDFGAPLSPGGPELTDELLARADFAPGARVLDVGCGQGRSLGQIEALGLEAIGIDTDPEALAQAQYTHPETDLLLGSGMVLPFADGALDGILSECVLSVIHDKPRALVEWARVLRPGGRLLLSDVYARRYRPEGAGGVLSEETLRGAIAAAGLILERFEDRSERLRDWVARFIFHYGSLDALWGDAETSAAMRSVSPGYCLLIAVKPTADASDPIPTAGGPNHG